MGVRSRDGRLQTGDEKREKINEKRTNECHPERSEGSAQMVIVKNPSLRSG